MTEQLPRDAIVVGVDSSADSDLALDWALNLARHTHQPVHAVHLQPFPPVTVTRDERGGQGWATSGRGIVTAAILRGRKVRGVPMSGQSLEVERDPGEGSGRGVPRGLDACRRGPRARRRRQACSPGP